MSSSARTSMLAVRRPTPNAGFLISILITLLALTFKWLVFPTAGQEIGYLVFTGCVMAAAWFGGIFPGMLAVALLAIGDSAMYLYQRLGLFEAEHLLALLLFATVAGMAAVFVGRIPLVVQPSSGQLNRTLLQDEMQRHRATGAALEASENMFELLVKSVEDYAIFMLNPEGIVSSWNTGAQRIKGYQAEDIIGQSFVKFYAPEDVETGRPFRGLKLAIEHGHYEDEGWRMRKDGSRFWANIVITAVKDSTGELIGFAKVTRDATQRRVAEQALQKAKTELEQRVIERAAANKELEAFSYSVSHDLRAPLRHLSGFSQALLEDYSDAVDEEGRTYLHYIKDAGERMERLIEELLKLSQLTTGPLRIENVGLTDMARQIVPEVQHLHPNRQIEFKIQEVPDVMGDNTLLHVVLYNLLDNGAKFTQKQERAVIEFGYKNDDQGIYYVRDNGVGFDMKYSERLFGPFQRLHSQDEFTGTGVGLATCQRILRRHGGRMWAEAVPGQGATFYFSIGNPYLE